MITKHTFNTNALITILLCAIALFTFAACGGPEATSTGNEVYMTNNEFDRTTVTIKKGESVTLTSKSMAPHTIANGTWDSGTAKKAREDGAPAIQDIEIKGNSSDKIGPFNQAGTFQIYCPIHVGMELTVIVQ